MRMVEAFRMVAFHRVEVVVAVVAFQPILQFHPEIEQVLRVVAGSKRGLDSVVHLYYLV